MSEKVVVSKEVAEAIESIRLNRIVLDELIRALYIGYEVEMTPKDRVKELFEKCKDERRLYDSHKSPLTMHYYDGKLDGIKESIDILGIKIEGVNS